MEHDRGKSRSFDNFKSEHALLDPDAVSTTSSTLFFSRSTLSTKNKERRSVGKMSVPALTAVRKEAQKIAKNPKQFLDNYAEGKVMPGISDTSSLSAIMAYLDEKRNSLLTEKVEELENQNKLSKTRTLLLSMSSGAVMNPKGKLTSGTSTPAWNSSGRNGSGDTPNDSSRSLESIETEQEDGYFNSNLDKNDVAELEKAIQGFVDHVKSVNIDDIVIWITTLATLEVGKLPYGYPTELQLPKNPEKVKDAYLKAFVESGYDEFLLLDAEYNAKLTQVGKRLKENWDSLQSSKWTTRDSALLFYIITELEENYNTQFRAQLIKKLFPQYSEEKVSFQKYRLKIKKAWEEKWRNIINDWIRDKEELVYKINEGWEVINKHAVKKKKLDTERREQLQRCAYWKEQLEKLRIKKQQRIRNIQIMVEPFEKNLEAKEHNRLKEEWTKREFQRKLLEEYKKEQTETATQARKEREQIQVELDKNSRLQNKYNQTRVQIRQLAYQEKVGTQKELERLRLEEQQLRAKLLEKTKERVEVDYHPANVLADTHCSLMRRHEVQNLLENEEESKMIKFFTERYGFSSEAVLKDRRLRLEGKLREVGLMGSSYARQVLASMEPKAKPHLQSQINFKQDE